MRARTRSTRAPVVALVVSALMVIAGCSGTSEPEPSTPPAPPTGSVTSPPVTSAPDVAVSPLGAKWVWAQFDEVKPYLTQMKGGHTYVEVVLCDVQKSQGSWDWKRPDSFVTRARAVGFGSLVKLRTGRCWATPGEAKHERGADVTESAMPGDMSVYTDFVTRAVQRYSAMGVSEFAIENEVSSPTFWDGSPEDYATLARAAADAVRAVNPDARVVDGSISSASTGYTVANALLEAGKEAEAVSTYQAYYARRFGTRGGEASIDEVTSVAELRTQLARPRPASSIAFMKAIDALFADKVFQVRQIHFYENWQALPATLDVIRANTPDAVPLEIWELGIYDEDRSVDEDTRTAEVVRATVIALAAGVTKVLWLPLLDNPSGRLGQNLYGLVAPSGQSRGSSSAYTLIARAAADGAAVSPVTKSGMAGAIFDSADPTMIAWATGAEVRLAPVPEASGTTLDADTKVAQLAPATSTVTRQPSLITTDGPLSDLQEVGR